MAIVYAVVAQQSLGELLVDLGTEIGERREEHFEQRLHAVTVGAERTEG